MDITNLESQLQMLQTIGYTLNTDQKIKLKLAHINLMEKITQLDQLKFWGKVQGISKTYYIMQGLKYRGSFQFPMKYYFWAQNDFQFKELPQLLLQHQGLSQQTNVLFSGDSNKILVNLQGEGGQEQPPQQKAQGGQQKQKPEEQQDEDLKKAPKKNFTQLHRLSTVVRAIDNDSFCVPRGSQKITPQHELHPNNKFYGLDQKNATNIASWFHFRAPQSEEAKKNMDDDMVIFGSNFLDGIDRDFPKGVWSIQLDSQKRNVSLRNLLWPGSYGFHRLNTANYGSVYIGDGIKNIDLPFMI